jgi:Ser/Thr protein kinase RdoA (MazF antagonist)
MRETENKLSQGWQSIEQQLGDIKAVEGGFSQARRGLVTLPSGEEIFVKVGLHENTKKWAKKEISVYRFLETHQFPSAPRLIATNTDETAFALEAFTPADGWDWQDNWDEDRLVATIRAMDDLAAIELDDKECLFFSESSISQDSNGWLPLLSSAEKQEVLKSKLHGIGAEDVANIIDYTDDAERSKAYQFADNTLVHYDLRADNCAWNADLMQVKIVDWNWTQLGDRDIELAATLTHIQKSGFDLPAELVKRLNADALHWMAGFWFNAAATPIWDGGPEHLRDFQLLAGITALRLEKKL